MFSKFTAFYQNYVKATLSLTLTFLLIRVYEYITIAHKSFVPHAFVYELLGWVYDAWIVSIYATVLIIPVFLIWHSNKKVGQSFFHVLNALLIITYISLLIVFSERNTPFDHEIYTRSFAESWATSKQMMSSGITVLLPFALYILLYLFIHYKWMNKIVLNQHALKAIVVTMIISFVFMGYANPSEEYFDQEKAYYFTANKFTYWMDDTYQYFKNIDQFNSDKLSPVALREQIDFYQASQGFQFTSKEYPLLRKNENNDVLGSFFNLNPSTPPNIVILVVEGLSRDFSGDNAYAGSFTPFLDDLSKRSLVWNNFLSTAPGTFAAHPAISGSLPYGKRGFSVINVMPDHLSLIKILRANGYHSKFLIGFNPDFDNMGGYMRLQGTDMILTEYPSKYKMMGVGEEGWSMGYPDDALYNRGFEVMDSLKHEPYLNIYHTGTTHMPYLFAQQAEYGKKFDRKIEGIANSNPIKKTLQQTKQVLVTYMFSDDCIKSFFKRYAKRPEYKNTIFFIMGDHHIGSFPSTNGLDDYHVPLIVYSQMIKQPKKFYSISSHNSIGPTITNLILKNYPSLHNKPDDVHWLTDVIDTAKQFRNIHSMPFMEWSREITDYIYKDYYLSGKQLYKIDSNLGITKIKNDTLKQHVTKLINNYKLINDYVTNKNKIYPANKSIATMQKDLLLDYNNTSTQTINTKSPDITIMPEIKIPLGYKFLYVELNADINLMLPGLDDQPAYRLSLIDTLNKKRNFVFWTNHNIVQMTKGDYVEKEWNATSTTDMIPLDSYKKFKNLVFDLSFFNNNRPNNLQLKGLQVKIYGVK
jgi:lipoteichoic acid synthase